MTSVQIKQKNETVRASFTPALLRNNPIGFWLDSSGGPSHLCNLSMLGTDPKYVMYGSLNEVYEKRTGDTAIRRYGENCFDFLEEKIKEEKHNKEGIFVGYFSYDLSDFFFAYFDKCHPEPKAKDLIALRDSSVVSPPQNDTLISNMTDFEYLEKVRLIKDEIKKGNVYQVNLTREYSLEIDNVNELDLYLKLRSVSPNPYGCFFKTPFMTILSSSPEEFLYIEPAIRRNGDTAKRTIRTRPIKGTLPKNVFDIDPKNKAENIMIVDLERNDLGRICEYGSITAKSLLNIESYEHLNHVVSTVEGKLKPDITLRQIFEALFPGGSITGAPKISAMKIIDSIEPAKRGAYTGSFGYIKTNGEMNFNILIRTIFITHKCHPERSEGSHNIMRSFVANAPQDDNSTIVTFNVGGGIVADSDPESELEEIKLKAKGIIQTIGIENL